MGDWVAAHAVDEAAATTLSVAGRKPVLALFDGQPAPLEPGIPITCGRTRDAFIATNDS